MLQIGLGSGNRDLSFLKRQAKDNIRKYIDEMLPDLHPCICPLYNVMVQPVLDLSVVREEILVQPSWGGIERLFYLRGRKLKD